MNKKKTELSLIINELINCKQWVINYNMTNQGLFSNFMILKHS
jgi:hypothetical protein